MGKKGNSLARRFTAFVLVMAMMITAMYVPVQAATVSSYNASGTVVNIKSTLVVRSKPSKSGSVLGSLKNGESVVITGKTSEWYRISYDSGNGYVSRDFIKVKTLNNSSVVSFSSKGSIKVDGNLNVRKKASASSAIIGSLANGTNITINGETKDWYRIKYGSGNGFVSKKFVAVGVTTKQTTSTSSKKTSSEKTTSSNTSSSTSGTKVGTVSVNTSLIVRAGASTSSAIVGGYKNGAQVTILGTKGDFYKISYDGGTAYVMKKYITNVKSGSASSGSSTTTTNSSTTSKTSTSSGSSQVTKVSKTGYANVSTSLLVRSKPSASGTVIGRYYSGAKINITGELTNWYRVSYSGKTAYVNAAYVTFTAPKKSSSSVASSTTTTTTKSNTTTVSKTITSYHDIELDVPLYHQYDSRWASVSIGSTNLKANGCATTSLAMVEEYRTGATCTPPMMVKKLNYTSSGAVYWPAGTSQYTGTNYLSVIYQQLAEGHPVIVGARYTNGSMHFIVVYGYNGSSNSLSTSGFLVRDPGVGGTRTLKAFFSRSPIFYKLVYYA